MVHVCLTWCSSRSPKTYIQVVRYVLYIQCALCGSYDSFIPLIEILYHLLSHIWHFISVYILCEFMFLCMCGVYVLRSVYYYYFTLAFDFYVILYIIFHVFPINCVPTTSLYYSASNVTKDIMFCIYICCMNVVIYLYIDSSSVVCSSVLRWIVALFDEYVIN